MFILAKTDEKGNPTGYAVYNTVEGFNGENLYQMSHFFNTYEEAKVYMKRWEDFD